MESRTGQANLDQNDQEDRFGQQSGWKQDQDQIQWAGDIIGQQGIEIGPQAAGPGIKQAIQGTQAGLDFRKEGCILMVEVNRQDIAVAHREDAAAEIADHEDDERNRK